MYVAEIIPQELISNTLDVTLHDPLQDPSKLDSDNSLYILVTADKEHSLFFICDIGTGMTKADLVSSGTIAKPDTHQFSEAAMSDADISMTGNPPHLIISDEALILGDQFGISFSNTYLIAEKVQVVSENEQYHWSSSVGGFSVARDVDRSSVGHTEVRLHLREDQGEYLDEHKVVSQLL